MTKFVIVANGEFIPSGLIKKIIESKTVVALDGASKKLVERNIIPHVILGDFDSVEQFGVKEWFGIDSDKTDKVYDGKYNVKIVSRADQDFTDLQKAIQYCDEQGAVSIEVICALGGRMDHALMNERVLSWGYKPSRPLKLHTESQTLYCADNTRVELLGEKGDYCGIFSCPNVEDGPQGKQYQIKSHFKATGLEWGDGYDLFYAQVDSACNRLTSEVAEVDVTGRVLIVAPGEYPLQRNYRDNQEKKLLEERYKDSQYEAFEVSVQELKNFYTNRSAFKEYFKIAENSGEKKETVKLVSCDKSKIIAGSYDGPKVLVSIKNKKCLLFKEISADLLDKDDKKAENLAKNYYGSRFL
ncbi:MAG: thiamine diphosphokinase [Proteobacteria bacterium]|nr:thiamine diphosphokinase [Pseudomonadota bacterium]